jgi:tetratricopeptide (TPR) repeat protein
MSASEQSAPTLERIHMRRLWNLEPREAAMLAGILVATALIYMPSIRNGWVFDDEIQIVRGVLLHSWTGIGKSFIHDSWWFRRPTSLPQSSYYRPLQAGWFGLNYMMLGNHPAAWHLEKIVLELIGVMLAFRLAQLLTGSSTVGLLTAAFFGLMPANAESVVWASAIGGPLSTVFEMGALCCFINRKPGTGLSRGLMFALALCAAALLSHETAILFPPIVAAYVFLFEGRQSAGVARRIVSALRACAPFVVMVIAYMCARVNALGFEYVFGFHQASDSMNVRGFAGPRAHHSLAEILMTLPAVLITYLAVLALPAIAGPTHAVRWVTQLQPIVLMTAAALMLIASAAFILAWRSSNRRIYLFCAAWSFLTMAPALNLNALWYLVDDRYLYAPSFGWSLAVAVAALEIAAAGSIVRKAVGAAIAVLLVVYAASTMQTERYWRDDLAFFHRCVEIAPYDLEYRGNLAGAMNRAGDREGALRELRLTLALDPDSAPLQLALALQYQRMGREVDFEREFQKFNELSAAQILRQRAADGLGASQPAGTP